MLQRLRQFTKTQDRKDPETVALLPQAEDKRFEDEPMLVGKYVRTDNRPYDFYAFYSIDNKNFMLRITGVPVENVMSGPSDINEIPINKAWFNGFSTFVKLSESSFKNLKNTLENKTGVWEDSIFDGKWFTHDQYESLSKASTTNTFANLGGKHVISKPRRNRRSSRRKSNKRRRSRRNINRKTKKN